METKTYSVEGLACADCAGRIQASVGRMAGVQSCAVDVATGRMTIQVTASDFDDAPVAKVVEGTGHRLLAGRRRAASQSFIAAFFKFLLSRRETALVLIAGGLTLLGVLSAMASQPWSFAPFALAIALGGWPVARHAYQEAFVARGLGINTLMVFAVAGALVIGEWPEAAIVVVLFALGEALEGYAAEQSRGALEGLRDLAPPMALRLSPDGQTETVPVAALVVGERVRVRPGDRVSVDGVVRAGQSAVDQSAITGESIPVDKAPGDAVFAGTVNTSGALEIEATRLAADNTLNRMVTLVQEAQSRQAPVQRFVDRFARVYTPTVAAVALLLATLPPLWLHQPFWGEHGWLMRALQMLVIACPCALVISTPVTVVSALTHAAQRGVLVKGGRTLEALGRVEIFAFDKTGTLTMGRPVTTDVLDVCEDAGCTAGLQYAAAVEVQSSHPLARALVAEAQARRVTLLPAEDVTVIGGRGVTGRVNGMQVTVASHPHFDAVIPHPDAVCCAAERLSADGKTVMLVEHDSRVCSIFAVADTARPESREALASLQALGQARTGAVRGLRTVMLTGDGATVAQAIGQQLGVDDVRAGLLPEDKVAAVQALMAEGAVAMVGDGINDAPALAQATVGIAMGGAGSAQAMETADVVLMGDDLRSLPFLVQLSRRTQRIIRANIILALGVKVLVFALAAAGAATLWMAIVADVGASLAVIVNGLRMRRG